MYVCMRIYKNMHTSVICVCVCVCVRAHVCHGTLGEMGENSIEDVSTALVWSCNTSTPGKHSTNWARYHPSAVMKE